MNHDTHVNASPVERARPTVGRQSATRRTYNVEEVAHLLGISRTTAYECTHTGEIPSLRFRRRIVIPAAVIDQLLSDAG